MRIADTAYRNGQTYATVKLALRRPDLDHPAVQEHLDYEQADQASRLMSLGLVGGGLGGYALGRMATGNTGVGVAGALLGGGALGYAGYHAGMSSGKATHDAEVQRILNSPDTARRSVQEDLTTRAKLRMAARGLASAAAYDDVLYGGASAAATGLSEYDRQQRRRAMVEALVGLKG